MFLREILLIILVEVVAQFVAYVHGSIGAVILEIFVVMIFLGGKK